jgi:sarcosine oxidase subunit gamma
MPENYLRQSPLAHLHLIARADAPAATAGVRLSEKAFAKQFVLRGDAEDAGFLSAVTEALAVGLPLAPNTVADLSHGALRVLWLGPDEWLVVAEDSIDLGGKLETIVADRHAAASDVSESRTILKLAGSRARDVLAKGWALDLHRRVFAPGQCAQSALAKVHIILHQTDEAPEYEIYVHRSYAEYLWAWLEDAGAEYGVAVGS